MTKKKSEKAKSGKQEKFWVVSDVNGGVKEGSSYSSFEKAKADAILDEDDIIYECVVTKKFVLKVRESWEEEK